MVLRNLALSLPIPCSAETVPPNSTALSANRWYNPSAFSRSAMSRGRMLMCTWLLPMWPKAAHSRPAPASALAVDRPHVGEALVRDRQVGSQLVQAGVSFLALGDDRVDGFRQDVAEILEPVQLTVFVGRPGIGQRRSAAPHHRVECVHRHGLVGRVEIQLEEECGSDRLRDEGGADRLGRPGSADRAEGRWRLPSTFPESRGGCGDPHAGLCTSAMACSSEERNWTTEIFGVRFSRPTVTSVMIPKAPSDPMKRSTRSMCGALKKPAVFLVRGEL